jgi:uncharacterized membrane protein YfcA
VTTDPLILGVLIVALTVGGVVNGIIGIGFALFAVNFLAAALGVKEAVIVISILAFFPSSYHLWRTRAHWPAWIRLRTFLAGGLAGALLGAQLLVILDPWAIALGLGLFTGQFVIDQARRHGPPIGAGMERRLAPVAGFFAGMTNGGLGASGPVAGSFLLAIGLRGREFIFGISLVFLFQAAVRMGLFVIAGQYTQELVLIAVALAIPTMGGQAIGLRLQGRANPTVFRRILLAILLVSSLGLLIRGGQGMLAWVGVA